MDPVPDRNPDAPRGADELLITAAEWEAMLLEDPQANPDWRDLPPYGSWRWRLPGHAAPALLPLADPGEEAAE